MWTETQIQPEINIDMSKMIIPMYRAVFGDIMGHRHSTYVFPGGRGSTKSSFVGGIVIPLLIINNPGVHAVCFRKVANTIQTSIFPQVVWGIYQLGLEDLFKIPKKYSTPIIYRPTGQQIIFMGLDDPNKVKSIKLPFGYIGITWEEELDQYAGENELRKVMQSTKRGGQLFWDFRTFNPPISKNNWANEYTEDCEIYRKEKTLVTRNTYLDVPRDWLSEEFIFEAEELKELNPRAYENEYLGVATGSGGDVFPNVSDLDMEQKVPFCDAYGNITKYVPMWQTFDHLYHAFDWGFAIDPFHYCGMHYDAKKLDLYIFKEYRTTQTRNETIYNELYNEKKLLTNQDLVIADSAEPKSIADFKSFGAYIRPVSKYGDSIRDGIKWLQGRRNIFIDKRRCPETWKEFSGYEYETDRDGNFISAYPDMDNHAIDSCLTGDTVISTPDGDFRIDSLVKTDGRIYSYDLETGEKKVANYINCRLTRENAEIWEIELEDGRVVNCTYDHKILTSNRGYVMACELKEGDDVVCV